MLSTVVYVFVYVYLPYNDRWVFDFEYVPLDASLREPVKYQYTKTDKAHTYRSDRDGLDEFLKAQDHVKYSTYQCRYEKGMNGFLEYGDRKFASENLRIFLMFQESQK